MRELQIYIIIVMKKEKKHSSKKHSKKRGGLNRQEEEQTEDQDLQHLENQIMDQMMESSQSQNEHSRVNLNYAGSRQAISQSSPMELRKKKGQSTQPRQQKQEVQINSETHTTESSQSPILSNQDHRGSIKKKDKNVLRKFTVKVDDKKIKKGPINSAQDSNFGNSLKQSKSQKNTLNKFGSSFASGIKETIDEQKMLIKGVGSVMNISEDQQYHDVLQSELKTGQQNKETYLKNYKIEMELPALFVQGSKLYSQDPQYCLQLVNFVLPQSTDVQVQTHYLHEKRVNVKYQNELYPNFQKGLVLRLLHHDDGKNLEIRKNLVLGLEVSTKVTKAIMKFSQNGKFFAIFLPELNSIRVVKIEDYDIEDMFEDFSAHNYYALIGKSQGLDKTSYDPYKTQVVDKDQDLSFVTSIEFDVNEKFILAVGESKVIIYALEKNYKKVFDIFDVYEYQKENIVQYEKICDIQFVSFNDSSYECEVACKVRNFKQIDTFNIEMKSSRKKSLTYFNEATENFQVNISLDFNQVILVNGSENFILLWDPEEEMYDQENLPQLKEKIVKYIHASFSCFYLVASHDYDQSLDIIHSARKNFPVEFDQDVEPGIIQVYDFHLEENLDKNRLKQDYDIRIVSIRDDEFQLNKATYSELYTVPFDNHLTFDQIQESLVQPLQKVEYQSENLSFISSFSIQWPYVAFSGLSANSLMIVNFFDDRMIQRVILGKDINKVIDTYITETNDLFLLTQVEEIYRLYQIDLDASNEMEKDDREDTSNQNINDKLYQLLNIFEYSLVDPKTGKQLSPFLGMHVRGSSKKEAIDLNQKLIVYFLHADILYSWTQNGNPKQQKYKSMQTLVEVCHTESQFNSIVKMNDQSFLLEQDIFVDGQESERIILITSGFSTFEKQIIFQESVKNEEIINFQLDQSEMKLIILSNVKSLGEDTKFKFEIFDMIKKDTIFTIFIKNKHLIGRLESGLFTFVDGHIYYGNNVIKIRYDLINISRTSALMCTEDQIFDFYFNIFSLHKNEKVRSNTPLDSIRGHRFAYIIQNQIDFTPKKLMVLPYLHERKIYLNRIKMNTDYFYTNIQSKFSLEKDSTTNNSIICMKKNEREYKYYVYSHRGILKNRVNFMDDVINYGEPIGTSANGKNYIFKKQDSTAISILQITIFGFVHIKDIDIYECIKSYQDQILQNNFINLYGKYSAVAFKEILSSNRKSWIDKKDAVNFKFMINDDMDVCIKISKIQSETQPKQRRQSLQQKPQAAKNVKAQQVHGHGHAHGQNTEGSNNEYSISNSNDLRNDRQSISIKNASEPQQKKLNQEYDMLYYFQDGLYNISEDLDEEDLEKVFNEKQQVTIHSFYKEYGTFDKNKFDENRMTSNHLILAKNRRQGNEDFTLNNNLILFWSDKNIWATKVTDDNSRKKFQDLSIKFSIAEHEKYQIKDIQVGNDSKQIAIVINQSLVQDCIVCWDTHQNIEDDAFDVGKDYQVIWDKYGFPYIVSEQKVIVTQKRCLLKCFDIDNLKQLMVASHHSNSHSSQEVDLSFDRGHRFDGENSNWVILSEFICLSFSYMTFVIKHEYELNEDLFRLFNQKQLQFDLEPYNYVFNEGTAFTNSKFVFEDHQYLWFVLKSMSEINLDYIQQIQYTQNRECINSDNEQKLVIISPLHLALAEGNNRSVDILLKFMTIIDSNSSDFFRSILYELVEYSSFQMYLKSLPVQTIEMSEKQILKVNSAEHERIVRVTDSPGVYIDDRFYHDRMGEDLNEKQSFPVNVKAMRIDWILNMPEGRKFLQTILQSNNMDLYEMESLQMLIEYLFKQYKKVIIFCHFPLFVLQLTSFYMLLALNEDQIENQTDSSLRLIVAIFNCFITFITAGLQIYSFLSLGFRFFFRFWSYIDTALTIVNIYISVNSYFLFGGHQQINTPDYFNNESEQELNIDIQALRVTETFSQMLILFKTFYYLKLFDEIAPLIDIILLIFSDIKYFMVIFLVTNFAFAISFYLLGKNQIQFDDFEEMPEYGTIIGAIWHMWTLCLGNPEVGFYNIPKWIEDKESASQTIYIMIIAIVTGFFVLIHLLNMLIAIMSETFAKNNQIKYKKKIKDHLSFVMDNWQFLKQAIPNHKQIKYIITAFLQEEQNTEINKLKKIENDISHVLSVIDGFQSSMMNELQKVHQVNDEQSKEILKLKNIIKNGGLNGKMLQSPSNNNGINQSIFGSAGAVGRQEQQFGSDRQINLQELKIISDPYQMNESF